MEKLPVGSCLGMVLWCFSPEQTTKEQANEKAVLPRGCRKGW